MKSFILTLVFLVTLSSSLGWAAGPTYDRLYEGNGAVLVEKQIQAFLHVDARGVYSSDDTLLMVEILDFSFFKLPKSAQLDSDFWLPEQIQCFPEDRFKRGVFIRASFFCFQ